MSILIYGRNSVIAAIKAKRVQKLYFSNSFNDKRIISLVNEFKLPLTSLENRELSNLVKSNNHQGVVAMCDDYKYYSLDDLINDSKNVTNPILIMLDGIEDPHNLGAILRVADAFNALGVIVKKTAQAPLNATVDKVSTGAINYVKVAEVSNLNNAIEKLKKVGYWIVASDGDANEEYTSINYSSPIVLIIGSEGKGISSLIKRNSDFVVKINMFGHVNSLNASNALSIILSHIIYSRK